MASPKLFKGGFQQHEGDSDSAPSESGVSDRMEDSNDSYYDDESAEAPLPKLTDDEVGCQSLISLLLFTFAYIPHLQIPETPLALTGLFLLLGDSI